MKQKPIVLRSLILALLTLFILALTTTANQLTPVAYLPSLSHPADELTIYHFQANVSQADPGDSITLSWSSNGTQATLYRLLPTLQLGQFWTVPPTGSFTYDINLNEYNHTRFMLFVGDETDTHISADLTVNLTCLFSWFFTPAPTVCPTTAPIISPAAEQPFEHGYMIWVAAENLIYVLYDDTEFTDGWNAYTDSWEEGDPVQDDSLQPPPGLYQPQRGFGLVWREQPTVRDRLGWATSPEVGFETAVQRTSYAKYNDTYLRAADNNLWRLLPERSDWEKLILP